MKKLLLLIPLLLIPLIAFGIIPPAGESPSSGGAATWGLVTGTLSDQAEFSVFGATIVDDADEAAVRITIGAYGSDDSVKSAGIDWADIGNLGENGLPNDFALGADADAGDFDIKSVDKLEGVDTNTYVDLGEAGYLLIYDHAIIKDRAPDIRLEYDALAYLKIVTADGGITTISQESDGTDGITFGDGTDNIIIAADNWTVSTSGNASFGGTVSAAPSATPGWTGYASNHANDAVAKHSSAGDGTDADWSFYVQVGDVITTEFFRLDGQDEKIVVSKPIQLDDNTSLSIEGGADQMDDHEYNGKVVAGIDAGEAIAIFEAVYLADDSDPIKLANATQGGGAYPAFGIAVAAASDTAPVTILREGVIRDETWSALTEGAPIYLGETGNETLGGMLTTVAPSTANDCIQIVGWIISESEIYFDFSRPYQLVE